MGGKIIKSQEGTTQGDPLAMPLYGLSMVPLIMSLSSVQVQQVWYADDSAATGSLPNLHQLWLNMQEKGASAWLSALPLKGFNFSLHKGAFRDAIAVPYGWIPKELPTECVCGSKFSVEHALSCNRGGFPTLRHNEVRDLTASLLSVVCSNVCVEPELQKLSGEALSHLANKENGARADIVMDCFWESGRAKKFCDIWVFNPFAPSNRKTSIASTYRTHEREKSNQSKEYPK